MIAYKPPKYCFWRYVNIRYQLPGLVAHITTPSLPQWLNFRPYFVATYAKMSICLLTCILDGNQMPREIRNNLVYISICTYFNRQVKFYEQIVNFRVISQITMDSPPLLGLWNLSLKHVSRHFWSINFFFWYKNFFQTKIFKNFWPKIYFRVFEFFFAYFI